MDESAELFRLDDTIAALERLALHDETDILVVVLSVLRDLRTEIAAAVESRWN
jgi:hypothetical protein